MDDPIKLVDQAMVSGFGQLFVLKQSCLTNQLHGHIRVSSSSLGGGSQRPTLLQASALPVLSLSLDLSLERWSVGCPPLRFSSISTRVHGWKLPAPAFHGRPRVQTLFSRFRPRPSGPRLGCSRLPRRPTPDSTSPASVPRTALGGRAQLPVSNSLGHAYVLWLPFLYEAMHGSADDTEPGSGSTTSNTVSSQLYDRLSAPSSVPAAISFRPRPGSLPNPDHPPMAHLLSLFSYAPPLRLPALVLQTPEYDSFVQAASASRLFPDSPAPRLPALHPSLSSSVALSS